MDNKPMIVTEVDGVKINIRFEHFSPKRIAQEGLKKVRPGTVCTLSLGMSNVAYDFKGRSFLHPGDRFNGNKGMLHSLENAIDAVHQQFPWALDRGERQVIFAELHARITKSFGQQNTIRVYEEI
jgi:hypothetical protein